jgi:hypothetical protein
MHKYIRNIFNIYFEGVVKGCRVATQLPSRNFQIFGWMLVLVARCQALIDSIIGTRLGFKKSVHTVTAKSIATGVYD